MALNREGKITTRNQVDDYRYRSETLKEVNLVRFFMDTYEETQKAREEVIQEERGTSKRGRPRHQRHKYLDEHPRAKNKYRVTRHLGHHTIPNFIGLPFPREDDPGVADYYFGCMLLLLKPWRNPAELRLGYSNWKEAYTDFINSTEKSNIQIISNIQHFHRSKLSAEQARDAEQEGRTNAQDWLLTDQSEMDNDEAIHENEQAMRIPSAKDWALLRSRQSRSQKVELYVQTAILLAEEGGFFRERPYIYRPTATIALSEDRRRLLEWQETMKVKLDEVSNPNQEEDIDSGGIERITEQRITKNGITPNLPEVIEMPISEKPLDPLGLESLNLEQRRAYEIVRWHLDAWEMNQPVEQLLMLIHGEGGTGKSRVIQTITALFDSRDLTHKLAKAAPTGIAASLIGGETLHRALNMRPDTRGKQTSSGSKANLARKWRHKFLLIIDEDSMVSRAFLDTISSKIREGRINDTRDERPFGGLNVIMCGDFHQFPPIRGASLYSKIIKSGDIDGERGKNIFRSFNRCVLLKEQKRVKDSDWLMFLRRIRNGAVISEDLEMLRSLILKEDSLELQAPEWRNAKLITPRHAVRVEWNKRSLKQHSDETGNQIFCWDYECTLKGKPLDEATRYEFEKWVANRKENGAKFPLHEKLELAIGSQVMVTMNVDPDIDLANGTRAVVEKIILDPEEPPIGTEQRVHLRYLPLCVLVRVERTRCGRLSDLEENVIPIVPQILKHSFKSNVKTKKGSRTVTERQFPITLGDAFTDYRAQGQTLDFVLADLANPPTGSPLNLFHVYVALSRSPSRAGIRLIRDFDSKLFKKPYSEELIDQDAELVLLDNETKEWWKNLRMENRA